MVEISVDALEEILARAGESAGDVSETGLKGITVTEKAATVGSVTSSVLKFVGEHRYLTTIGVLGVGITGIAAYGATKGAITDIGTGLTNLVSPKAVVVQPLVIDNTGKVVPPVTVPTDTTKKTDTGLLGWFTDSFTTGLFGTQEKAASFMDQAKPWLIGGAIVVGAVATAYVVKSVRKPQVVVPIR